MNKIYFCLSDIHSFYQEFRFNLFKAGFRKTNNSHILIVCGDVFDRGFESVQVYKFINSLPKSRVILIKGNHEQLYLDLLNKKYPDNYDFSNGTVRTFCSIAEIDENSLEHYYRAGTYFNTEHNATNAQDIWNIIKAKVSISPITSWLKSSQWLNYYELDKYIFVHSFIPLHNKTNLGMYSQYGNYQLEYFLNWRTDSTKEEWDDACWGCPWMLFRDGYFNKELENNKILVCGHWHTSDFYNNLDPINYKTDYIESPIYSKDGLIGLDACTAISHKINVLVIKL